MPILGAVLHLTEDSQLQQATLRFLENHPAITLGPAQRQGLPMVLDCPTRDAERALWDELQSQPGILFCAVVYADFSDIVAREHHEHSKT